MFIESATKRIDSCERTKRARPARAVDDDYGWGRSQDIERDRLPRGRRVHSGDERRPPVGSSKKRRRSRSRSRSRIPRRRQERDGDDKSRWGRHSDRRRRYSEGGYRPTRQYEGRRPRDPRQGRAGIAARSGPAKEHRELNQDLCKCGSVQDVLSVMKRAWDKGVEPNAVNLATATHRVGKFWQRVRDKLSRDQRWSRFEIFLVFSIIVVRFSHTNKHVID